MAKLFSQLTQRPFVNSDPSLYRVSRFNPFFVISAIRADLKFKKVLHNPNKLNWILFIILRSFYIFYYYYVVETVNKIRTKLSFKSIKKFYNKLGISIDIYIPTDKSFLYLVSNVRPVPERQTRFVKVIKSELDTKIIADNLKELSFELLEINKNQSWSEYKENDYKALLKKLEVTSNRKAVNTYNIISFNYNPSDKVYYLMPLLKHKQSGYYGVKQSPEDEEKNKLGSDLETLNFHKAAERVRELVGRV